MPTIPQYDNSQVNQRALNLPQATPDSFGAQPAGTLARAGQALNAGSDVAGAIYERDIKTQVMDAEAKAKEAYDKWSAQELSNSQGANAKGLVQRNTDWWKKTTDDTAQGMPPLAASMLRRSLEQQRVASVGAVARYEQQQLDNNFTESTGATIKTSVDLASKNFTQQNLDTQRNNIVGAIAEYGKSKGQPPEWIKQKTDESVGAMHMAVFSNMVVNEPLAAKQYFENNRKEFPGTQIDNVLGKLKTAAAGAVGGDAARGVISELTQDRKPTDSFPYMEADKALVAKIKDPEELKAARAELDRQRGLWADRSATTLADAGERAMGMMFKQGMTLSQVRSSGAFDGLSAGEQAKAEQALTDEHRRRFAGSVQERLLVQQDLELKHAPEMWELTNNPEKLATMTDAEAKALWTTIGFGNAAKVQAARQQLLSSQAKLSEGKADADMFNITAEAAGLEPTEPKKSPEEAAQLVRLRNEAEMRIGQEQQKTKRELTRQEKQAVMQDVIDNKVTTGAWWWKKDRPVAVMSADDLKNAEVTVQGAASIYGPTEDTVKLSTIPAGDRASIIKAMQKNNIPVTEQGIAQMWYDAQKIKQPKK